MNKNKYDVVIIDTGVSEELSSLVSSGISFTGEDDNIIIQEDYGDKIGHGTAICDLFTRNDNNLKIFMIKIFDELTTTYERLCIALEYINKNIECDLIHISLGITLNDDYSRLRNVISNLNERKITIVAAFDNDGSISYPSGFTEVIGVSLSDFPNHNSGYFVVEGNIIDVVTSNNSYRVKWVNPRNNIIRGSSFSSVQVSRDLCEIIKKNGKLPKEELLKHLSQYSKGIIKMENNGFNNETSKQFINNIKKAIVFPFNKEMHSLAIYRNTLNFEIEGFYDISKSINSGRTINEVLNLQTENDERIKKFSLIDWEDDFDTIIVGHCDKLNDILRYDILKNIIDNANKYNKKIFFLDYIDTSKYKIENEYLCPKMLSPKDVFDNRFGKLRLSTKPILGVFGTSSRQGKFTLQLLLRNELIKEGYKVGQLGTEPTSLLFGIDEVYHFGYGSINQLNSNEVVNIINEMIWRIEQKDIDIIIVGSQSGTIPYDFSNLKRYTFPQFEFLLATKPDGYILVCNCYDDLDYIKRTIKFLESISGKVICLYLYPLDLKSTATGFGQSLIKINNDELQNHKERLEGETGKKVYSFDDVKLISELVINYYSEE